MMKITAKLALALFWGITLAGSLCAVSGCASTREQKGSDQQTMYDFIGGGKPEFDGKKY